MAKKKGKKTGEQGPPLPGSGDLMNELFGQLLSLDPATPEPAVPQPEALEAESVQEDAAVEPSFASEALPSEDTLGVLAAAMDSTSQAIPDSPLAGQPAEESLLAIVESTSPAAETPAAVEQPGAAAPAGTEPEIGIDVVVGPAAEAALAETAASQPLGEAQETVETPRAETQAPTVEAVADQAAQAGLEATEASAETEPEPALEVSEPAGATASRILRSRQQQETPAGEGVLDALIGAIDTEIARSPLAAAVSGSEDEETGAAETCAVFSLAGAVYGVPVQSIVEIDQAHEVTPVPNVPDFVRGVINLRGEIMCVLDLSAFVGQAPLPEDHAGWFLVVQGGRKQQTAALLVDEVRNLVRVPESQLRPPAGTIDDKVSSLLRGTLEKNDRILRVLSLDSLFESGELQQLRM